MTEVITKTLKDIIDDANQLAAEFALEEALEALNAGGAK